MLVVTEDEDKFTQQVRRVTTQLSTSTAAGQVTSIEPQESGKVDLLLLQQLMVM